RNLAAAPAARCVLEAWIGLRGLRGDPMPGICRWRLDRRLHQCDSAPSREPDGAAQGPHRAVGAQLSALFTSRPADRVPARNPALVGLLAERHRYRGNGRTDAAGLDDGQRETCLAPRCVAGPVGCRAFVAIAGNNTAAAVSDR